MFNNVLPQSKDEAIANGDEKVREALKRGSVYGK